MPLGNQRSNLTSISELLYLFFIVMSFYLLIASRTEEANTVWQVLHPVFIPTLFVTTFLLLTVLFTSEKTAHKLLFIIVYSILIHSFFSIIFPAGDLSGQQMVLGRTRRVFDNTTLPGLTGWPSKTIPMFIYEMFKGTNLQAALSTIFARMLSIDIFWVHLFFIPVLWGVFVPIASFLTTKTICGNDKVSVLASLLVSAFPYATYFGAISVPNSLGFIFFYYSLLFMLRYLSSSDSKMTYWMAAFSFFSFLAHYLTGGMSFSFLLLTVALKSYESEKESLPVTAEISLVASLICSAILLPLSFIFLRFFSPTTAGFSLAKFYELPVEEIVGLLLIGELIYGFDVRTILLVAVGPALGLLGIIYLLYKLKKNHISGFRIPILFLIAAFIVVLIDYRILKLFMEGLPINEERLWVFRDLIVAPFVALAIYPVISSVSTFLKATSLPNISIAALKSLSKGSLLRALSLLFVLNVIIPAALGGWVTLSLTAAYPQLAPLQTTWYELEAVKYIDENTKDNYVVICDMWTVFAGEMIVGIYNPQAFYFGEFDSRRQNLFDKMQRNPSPEVMIEAINQTGTDTSIAYFIVTEPRLGTESFSNVVSRILQENRFTLFHVSSNGKLYVFSYSRE